MGTNRTFLITGDHKAGDVDDPRPAQSSMRREPERRHMLGQTCTAADEVTVF
jgi:hypothetical protein